MARYGSQSSFVSAKTETVEVLTGRELTSSLTTTLNFVEKLVAIWRESGIVSGGEIVSTVESMLGLTVPETGPERLLIDLIREAVDNADVEAGSDPASTASLVSALTGLTIKRMHSGQTAQHAAARMILNLRQLRQGLYNSLQRPTQSHIDAIIQQSLGSKRAAEMIHTAMNLAGADGRIFFEASDVAEPIVELKTGYCFDLVAPCMSAIGHNEWSGESCRVAIIDGYIESVAEVDRLFTAAYDEKSPLIIFARKFDNDVLSTIAVNIRRGTVTVIPVIVPFDADSANVLKDIAVVCGGDVVTSLKGQLISSIKYKDLPVVQRMHVHGGAVVIQNESTSGPVSLHTAHLHAQAIDPKRALSASFVARRMRCLTSRMVSVRMPKNNDRVVLKVDRALRRVKTSIAQGIVHHKRVISLIESLQGDQALKGVLLSWCRNIEGDVSPLLALDSAIVNAGANARLLATTGAVLS